MQIAPGVSSNDLIGSVFNTSGNTSNSQRAMNEQLASYMASSNFANQQAQNTALFNQGLQRDDAQFYTGLNDLSTQRNRNQVFSLGQQGQDNDLQRNLDYRAADYGYNISEMLAGGRDDRKTIRQQGSEARKNQVIAGQQDRLTIGAQGQVESGLIRDRGFQDRRNIRASGQQDRRLAQTQGQQTRRNIGAQGTQDRRNIRTSGLQDRRLRLFVVLKR